MWELYTYGGGDFLRLVFNGLASIFGNDDYGVAVKISALCGLLSVMIMGAFRKGELNVQWLIGVVMIFQVALVPKTDIIIIDEVVPANSAVVSNIPLGISLIATVFSRFSHWATVTMETVFSMPGDIQYHGNGLLFANMLVEESTRFEFTSPNMAMNFSEFWKSCVYYDLLLGLYNWDSVVKSTDLVGYFQAHTSQTRAFTYVDGVDQRTIVNCRYGINNQLKNDYDAEIARSINIHGAQLAPNQVTQNEAVAKYSAAMPVAYQYMTGIAQTNAQIVGQNAVANSLKRGLINFASEADAPAAAQDFALARAEQERKTTFMTMGQIAKKMLPILQHLFEAFIYCLFPFVMLMAMTPLVGKVVLGYVKAVFWVNLWPPLYTILHFSVSYYSSQAARAAMLTDGTNFATGLSIMTNTGLGKVMEDYAAVAGYLSLSIPMIAWLLVSMSGAMMAGMAGRLMEGYESPVSKGADEATSGNMHLGNTQFQNNSAFQNNSSPTIDSGMIHERLGSGSMQNTTGAGRFLQQNVSSGGTSIDLGQSIVNASKQQLGNAVETRDEFAAQAATSNMAVLRESQQVLNNSSIGHGMNNSWKEGESNSDSMMLSKVDSALNKWAEKNDIELTDELKGAVYASIDTEGGFTVPVIGGISLKAGASVTGSTAETESTNYQNVQDFTSGAEFTDAVRSIAEATRQSVSSFGIENTDSTLKGLDSSLSEQQSNERNHNQAVSDVNSASETLERSEQFAATFKQNGLDKLHDYAVSNGKMTDTEFDQLTIAANRGGAAGAEAMQYLTTLAIDGVMTGGLDPEFSAVQDDMFDGGKSDINSDYANNFGNVQGVNQLWNDDVAARQAITAPAAEAIIASNENYIKGVFYDPATARTSSPTVDGIQSDRAIILAEGEATSNRVDGMRVLSDYAPGAAGVAGEQVREREIEELKEETQNRIKSRLQEK